MGKQKIIYLCCMADPWVDVIVGLWRDHDLVPAYIVGWRDDRSVYQDSELVGMFFHSIEEAWRGRGFPVGCEPTIFDEQQLKEISWHELQALQMMERLDPTGFFFPTNLRIRFFRNLVGRWISVINKSDVDMVVSPSIPHRVFDYALYVACELLNKVFIAFQMTPFGSNSIVISQIENMPEWRMEPDSECPSVSVVNRIELVKRDYGVAKPSYMREHEKSNRSMLAPVIRKLSSVWWNLRAGNFYKIKAPNTYWASLRTPPEDGGPGWIMYFSLGLYRALTVKRYRRLYHELAKRHVKPEGREYVLVALHYQPEETTSPTGGAYTDQLLIVELLHQVLPPSWAIVVKEHKSQFFLNQEGASGRSSAFYNKLGSLSGRVYFEPVESDPFKLIDQALATVTVSGTIGWESAIRGTPVLLFGRAWYEGMPRVHKIKSANDLVSVLSVLEGEKNMDLDAEILRFHAQAEMHFVKAKHYKANVGKNDVGREESIANLKAAILNCR